MSTLDFCGTHPAAQPPAIPPTTPQQPSSTDSSGSLCCCGICGTEWCFLWHNRVTAGENIIWYSEGYRTKANNHEASGVIIQVDNKSAGKFKEKNVTTKVNAARFTVYQVPSQCFLLLLVHLRGPWRNAFMRCFSIQDYWCSC